MIRYLMILLLCSFSMWSCSSEISYEQMVKNGLGSGVKQDSLFLGYHFGMDVQTFLSSSWELNRQGIITGQTKINYQLQDLDHIANMEFYPTFVGDVIVRMPVTIGYSGWAPWNEHLWPEVLVDDLIEYYGGIYETEFTPIYVPEIDGFAYVSIEGNREIRLYKNSQSTVRADFIDLSVYGKVQS